MIFASDNWAGASEPVIAALAAAARKGGPAYGADEITKAVERRFAEIFEHEVAVFLVASGTFANSLSLSAYARPGGIVYAHRDAHIGVDEAGATEFFGGGLKIAPLEADAGKISPVALTAALERFSVRSFHAGQPVALSVTQLTELGAAYTPGDVATLAKIAKSTGIAVHMDGARFANAIAGLGVSPADMTWRAGVDVLSFGGTKNGCIAAEAVIFFDAKHAANAGFVRQRAGHGFSKNWFVAAQLAAYLEKDHWLDLARHSNAMAARLVAAVRGSKRARLAFEPAGNEVFVILETAVDQRLRAAGAQYYPWTPESLPVAERPGPGEALVRMLTSWQTTAADVDRLGGLLD